MFAILPVWTRGGLLPPATLKAMVPRAEPETGMSDDLTNSEIALLCDIGELHLPKLTGDQKRDLERLISAGYVEPTEGHGRSAFMLTAKGVEFLGKRGAGLNEA